jgi:hypothetical protein
MEEEHGGDIAFVGPGGGASLTPKLVGKKLSRERIREQIGSRYGCPILEEPGDLQSTVEHAT